MFMDGLDPLELREEWERSGMAEVRSIDAGLTLNHMPRFRALDAGV